MKILIVTNEGFENGGVSTYVTNLKKQLILHKHTVKILSSDRGPKHNRFNDYSYEAIPDNAGYMRYLRRLFNLSSYRVLRSLLVSFKPDLVHLNYIDGDTSPSVLLALAGTPTVFTLHDYSMLLPPGLMYKAGRHGTGIHVDFYDYGSLFGYIFENIKRMIYLLLKRYVNNFIVPSQGMKKYFNKNGIPNVTTINNGVLLKSYTKPNLDKVNLLYVGRLSKEKGVEYLIRSMSLLVKEYPSLILSVVGDGPQESNLVDIVKTLKLQKNVRFVGKVHHKILKKYYIDSTIVVIPSVCYESFSLVGIEAMSYGRPLIASNIGAIPEWMRDGETGYLIQPADSVDIYHKVSKMLSSPHKLLKFSKNAHTRSKLYSLEKQMTSILNIYKHFGK